MSIIVPRLLRKPRLGACRLDRQHPLSRGLVAWWLFNEGGGVKLWDIVGSNHGTLTNMDPSTDWVGSPRGGALDFDGVGGASGDYIACGNPADLQITGAMTIAGRYLDRSSDTGKFNRLVTKFGSPTNQGYELTRQSSSDTIHMSVATSATASVEVIAATNLLASLLNQWHTWVGVFDPSVALRIYLDGKLDNENTTSIPASQHNSTSVVGLGRYLGSTASGAYLDGRIEDIRIWTRVLTHSEIAWLEQEPYAGIVTPQYRRYFIPAGAGGSTTYHYFGLMGVGPVTR